MGNSCFVAAKKLLEAHLRCGSMHSSRIFMIRKDDVDDFKNPAQPMCWVNGCVVVSIIGRTRFAGCENRQGQTGRFPSKRFSDFSEDWPWLV